MPVIKLTKTCIDGIPFSSSGQSFYIDSLLSGFGLRVGKKTKAFYAQKRIKGKDKRITIGLYGQITLDQARREAQRLLGMMATGENPIDEKKQERAFSTTLEEAFKAYMEARKTLKPRTRHDYRYMMDHCLSNWLNKELISITKDMVEARYLELGSCSQSQANYAMRILRAVFNFAIGKYEDSQGKPIIQTNPVLRLSQTRAWYEVERRRTVISSDQLKPFVEAANNVENKMIGDCLLFLLFTGLRKKEGFSLKWEQVNFNTKTFFIWDTKNKEPLHLPMSDYVYKLLENRQKERLNEYVFPGEGKTGHLVEARRQMEKTTEQSGVSFTLHDFRRTFITIAESLDISAYALKHLVNHKMKGDVTAGYIIMDVERLRKPMQRITDYILEKAGVQGQRSM